MNFLDKLAVWFYQCRLKSQQKKRAKIKKTETEKKREKIHQNLKDIYDFVRWLNTSGLSNRRARKDFWMRVKEGEPLLEKTLTNLIAQYAPKKETSENQTEEKKYE